MISSSTTKIAFFSFLLRNALGITFLSAVADRFGMWGEPGNALVTWGNWNNFVQYTSELSFNASYSIATVLGGVATGMEIILGVLLIIGYKVRESAFFSGILLLIFALGMAINAHVKYAFDYSVFTASFGAFLLATTPHSKWSLDNVVGK